MQKSPPFGVDFFDSLKFPKGDSFREFFVLWAIAWNRFCGISSVGDKKKWCLKNKKIEILKKFFLKIRKILKEKWQKSEKLSRNKKENRVKKGSGCEIWYASESTSGLICNTFGNVKKVLKKVEKILKKVLTNENICDRLYERSTEGRTKQRSLKIEQQQIRTN